jgi:kynureninase
MKNHGNVNYPDDGAAGPPPCPTSEPDCDLLRWRDEFPILGKTVYLISNSLGAMPRGVYRALEEYADAWATRGVQAWSDSWWDMPVSAGNLLTPIIGSGPNEVSFHQNVTAAQAVVLSCFEFTGERRKVVYSSLEFPSIRYLYQAQRGRGAEICVVDSPDGIAVDLEHLLRAIDERTLLVPISHVSFKSSSLIDARAVIRRAHDVGALVILDVYQSAGTVPIDVGELDADVVIGGCLKWLCGGPGTAFLYVRPDLRRRLEPKFTGWTAHRNPFGFEPEMSLREDAFRYLTGTPHIPCLYAARPGLEIVGRIGVARIRRKSILQTSRLAELALESGFRLSSPAKAEERGGTVVVNSPNAYEVCQELLRREFLVDFRPGAGIRISPHFYTTDGEIEAVVREIRKIQETKAYEKNRSGGPPGTGRIG